MGIRGYGGPGVVLGDDGNGGGVGWWQRHDARAALQLAQEALAAAEAVRMARQRLDRATLALMEAEARLYRALAAWSEATGVTVPLTAPRRDDPELDDSE